MKLPVVSGKEVIKFLSKEGFYIASQKGSHVRMKKKINSKTLVAIIPMHKRLDPGTLLSILRQTEIQKDDFISKMNS